MKPYKGYNHIEKTFPGSFSMHEYLDLLCKISCRKLHELLSDTTDENLDQVLSSIERMNDILDDAVERIILET